MKLPQVGNWSRRGDQFYDDEERLHFVKVDHVTTESGPGYQLTLYKRDKPHSSNIERVTSTFVRFKDEIPDAMQGF